MSEPLEQPDRLHVVAALVIWACSGPTVHPYRGLAAYEKIVWYHHWLLDDTPADGAYISARSLAERLGLSHKTIEDIRSRLVALGLATSFRRHGEVQPGWRALLPASLVPKARTLIAAVREAPALARKLAERIDAYDRGIVRPMAEDRSAHWRESVPRDHGGRFRQPAEQASVNARSASAGSGGPQGGHSASAVDAKASTLPAVTESGTAGRVGAFAPEGEAEGPKSRAELRAIAQADGEARERTEAEGWDDIARRKAAFRQQAEQERSAKERNR